MTTATKLTHEQLDFYSREAPEKAQVLLAHEDGRILPAVEYKRGSGFWYPDGRVAALNGIFDDVTLVAVRKNGYFVNLLNPTKTEAQPQPARVARMQEQQMKLVKARQPREGAMLVKPAKEVVMKHEEIPAVNKEFQDVLGLKGHIVKSPEPILRADKGDSMPNTDVFEDVRQGVFGEDDDFVSIADLQSNTHRKGELFICLRTSGQIVFPKLISDLIGQNPFDMQLSQKKRMLRITIGTGPMTLPKSGKMSCFNLIRIIHALKGLDGDPGKTSIGRILFQQPDPQKLVFIGTF